LFCKAVYKWVQKHGIYFVDDKEVETEVQKWQRQQSKGFCTVGFVALVKQWNAGINVGEK
jgi:hypothetical protein